MSQISDAYRGLQLGNRWDRAPKWVRSVALLLVVAFAVYLPFLNILPFAYIRTDLSPTGSDWESDQTDMKPELHERKYEIDSLCYPTRLAYYYWMVTGDESVFGEEWLSAVANILKTFREQQRK